MNNKVSNEAHLGLKNVMHKGNMHDHAVKRNILARKNARCSSCYKVVKVPAVLKLNTDSSRKLPFLVSYRYTHIYIYYAAQIKLLQKMLYEIVTDSVYTRFHVTFVFKTLLPAIH